jgi:hypothetical protein
MRVLHEFRLAGGAGREVDQRGVIRGVWVVSRDSMATASASRTGATDAERRRSRCGRIPWDVSEFVDLVGTGDDMAHRSPTDAVSEVRGPQCGGGRHDDAQRNSRVARRDGVESVERPVEPVADVGPAERRDCGVVIVAVSHQDVAARALCFSAS